MDVVQLVAVWLHTVAFVIAWGYYGILARMVIPGLERTLTPAQRAAALRDIEGRALPLVLIAVVLFVITGSYLLTVDPQYAGLGNVTATSWATLMTLKHGLVVLLVALGVVIDFLIVRAAQATNDAVRASRLRWLRVSAEAATALGALIVLVTAAAQLS